MCRLFPPRDRRLRALTDDAFETIEKGHGRIEHRRIETTTRLNDYLGGDWPSVGQAIKVTRRVTQNEKTTVDVAYLIASTTPAQMPAKSGLAAVRDHWGIENQLHWTRDVVLGEDRCRVRTGSAPQVLAAIRNTALTLIRRAGFGSPTRAIRRLSLLPERAINLVLQPVGVTTTATSQDG